MVEGMDFDIWPFSSDRLLERHFKGRSCSTYSVVDSNHTETFFTSKDGKSGFVFVGTPYGCEDYIERMQILEKDYLTRGCRISPESIKPKAGVAGFFWVTPGGRI